MGEGSTIPIRRERSRGLDERARTVHDGRRQRKGWDLCTEPHEETWDTGAGGRWLRAHYQAVGRDCSTSYCWWTSAQVIYNFIVMGHTNHKGRGLIIGKINLTDHHPLQEQICKKIQVLKILQTTLMCLLVGWNIELVFEQSHNDIGIAKYAFYWHFTLWTSIEYVPQFSVSMTKISENIYIYF